MRKALVVEKFLKEAVGFCQRSRVVYLLVVLGHEKGRVVNPIITTSKTLVTKVDDWIGGKFLGFQQNTELGVWFFSSRGEELF